MGFWDKLLGRRKREAAKSTPASPSQPESARSALEQSRQRLWEASPKSRCEVCGRELRGLSGGIIMGSGIDFVEMMLEGARYICPKCGFVGCFECCADTKVYKVICKRCGGEMQRG